MRTRYLAVGPVLAWVGLGCTSMQTVEPQRFIPQHKPGSVSVWTTPTDVTIVTDPQIEGDTLSGVVLEERWTVPLKDIVRVEVNAPDHKKTALLIAGTAASALGMVLLVSGSRKEVPRPSCTDTDDITC